MTAPIDLRFDTITQPADAMRTATNTALDTLAAPFDWVAMAFSKGPGAPGGWMARGIQ